MRSEVSPGELRHIIDAIPDKVEVPYRTGTWKVDGNLMRSLNRFLYVTGCRVSEAVTKETRSGGRATGIELTMTPNRWLNEDAVVWNINTLKRKVGTHRNVALPLNKEYEPYAEILVEDWADGNPYNLTYNTAYAANRVIFRDVAYRIEEQRVQVNNPEIRRRYADSAPSSEKAQQIMATGVLFEAPEHMKRGALHFLRHTRARELTVDYGFSDAELMTYFGWSPLTMGKNPYMQRYQNLRWQDYYAKLLRRR